MNKYVFLYKERDTEDRDCVKYIESMPTGAIGIHGACFSSCLKENEFDYDNITTLLTRKDFDDIFLYNKEMSEIRFITIHEGDEKYQKKLDLLELIKPVLDKLNSEGNKLLLEKVIEEEKEYIQDRYSMSKDDIEEIFENYDGEYRDRAIISYVYEDIEECGYEYAHCCMCIDKQVERYFDYEKLGVDLLDGGYYIELTDGRVVSMSY